MISVFMPDRERWGIIFTLKIFGFVYNLTYNYAHRYIIIISLSLFCFAYCCLLVIGGRSTKAAVIWHSWGLIGLRAFVFAYCGETQPEQAEENNCERFYIEFLCIRNIYVLLFVGNMIELGFNPTTARVT